MQQFETEERTSSSSSNGASTPSGYTPEEYRRVVRKAQELRREREGRVSTDVLIESAAEVGIAEEDLRAAERALEEEKRQGAQRKSRLAMIGVGTGLVLGIFTMVSYNSLNGSRLAAQEAEANLQSTLQRRADLVEQLLPVVRAGAAQEREVTERLADARQGLQAGDLNRAAGSLKQGVARLTEAASQDSAFRASENYRTFQVQIEGSENRIAEYRKRYNRAVTDYNRAATGFPTGLVRPVLGFPSSLKPFEAGAGAESVPKL